MNLKQYAPHLLYIISTTTSPQPLAFTEGIITTHSSFSQSGAHKRTPSHDFINATLSTCQSNDIINSATSSTGLRNNLGQDTVVKAEICKVSQPSTISATTTTNPTTSTTTTTPTTSTTTTKTDNPSTTQSQYLSDALIARNKDEMRIRDPRNIEWKKDFKNDNSLKNLQDPNTLELNLKIAGNAIIYLSVFYLIN